jgi:hypothetical protein
MTEAKLTTTRTSSLDPPLVVALSIRSDRWWRRLVALHIVLCALSVSGEWWLVQAPTSGFVAWFAGLTTVDGELSVPKLVSVLQLFVVVLVSAIIAYGFQRAAAPARRRWWLLTALVSLAMIDESLALHEATMEPIRDFLGVTRPGIWYHAWIIPGALIACLVAIVVWKCVSDLPSSARWLVLAGSALAAAGSLGMEAIGGVENPQSLIPTYEWIVVTTVEEFLEMVGVALFLVGLLRSSPAIPRRVDLTIT